MVEKGLIRGIVHRSMRRAKYRVRLSFGIVASFGICHAGGQAHHWLQIAHLTARRNL